MSVLNTTVANRVPFEDLYRSFWPRIFGYVQRQVEGRADAEDITAEVFLRAYNAYSYFEPRPGPAPWLFTIARHACSDHRRRLAMQARLTESLAVRTEPINPEQIVERRFELDQLRHQVSRLPLRQQQVLGWFHAHGLSFKEAAVRLRCSEDAAKMLCHRGLKALRPAVRRAA